MFSLCYLPTAGRLTLTVIKCRNLKAMDITGYSGRISPLKALLPLSIKIRRGECGESVKPSLNLENILYVTIRFERNIW